jgi:ABC-type xylose transport system substrate-binding protein|tara:strand:- start:70 stop:378 length:309 start_codon:yes stop_codon:yes gene_type:complete
MGRIFHDKAIQKGTEQGFSKFQIIKLLAVRASHKQQAVKGIKYLTPEQQRWHKEQSKFTIQAVKELADGDLNLQEFYTEITTPIEEVSNEITQEEEKETDKD